MLLPGTSWPGFLKCAIIQPPVFRLATAARLGPGLGVPSARLWQLEHFSSRKYPIPVNSSGESWAQPGASAMPVDRRPELSGVVITASTVRTPHPADPNTTAPTAVVRRATRTTL